MSGRRRFLRHLIGVAAVSPFTLRAQQTAVATIGFLHSQSQAAYGHFVKPFRDGLASGGFIEGRNAAIDYFWADGRDDRVPALAAELAKRRVAVIAAFGTVATVRAAMAATKTIPIVFAVGGDPVAAGLVKNLARPEGNATGVTFFTVALSHKRLELLRELVPQLKRVAALYNPRHVGQPAIDELQGSARALGLQLDTVAAGSQSDIDTAINRITGQKAQALLVVSSPLFVSQREQMVALTARHRLPAMYAQHELVDAGGFSSYGASTADAYRQAGVYVSRVLNGSKPADLPVQQPSKFELVVNLKTAQALGIPVPQSVLIQATRVIE